MPGFYKLKANSKFHVTSWFYKVPTDSKWHPVRNVFYKVPSDGKWHPMWLYEWQPGPWNPCSASCGGGTQTRTVKCVRSDTIVVHDSFCKAETKPATQQVCNTNPCGFTLYWAFDDGCRIYLNDILIYDAWGTTYRWGYFGSIYLNLTKPTNQNILRISVNGWDGPPNGCAAYRGDTGAWLKPYAASGGYDYYWTNSSGWVAGYWTRFGGKGSMDFYYRL